ncbi:MAG TPA: DUF1684 domain-containing protein [Salinimicrobium sp.]|nr:DUF1684 domain-containing protein [Salinimicrobium sp.]
MKKSIFILLFLFSTSMMFGQTHSEDVEAFQNKMNQDFLNPEESPLSPKQIKKFNGHDFFPIDENYKIVAKFDKAEDAVPFSMKTTTDRLPLYKIYGTATFEIEGKTYTLNIYQSEKITPGYENHLFFPFTDLTNGEETYTGGRYIDLTIPEGNSIIIDFNKAYNPYCAYSGNYSCPIPPKENDLNTEIKAGIKYF